MRHVKMLEHAFRAGGGACVSRVFAPEFMMFGENCFVY